MTAAVPEYSDLHNLVDLLTLDQARALRAVALQLVRADPPNADADPSGHVPIRRISFVGVGSAGPDLAASSQKILNSELGNEPR